MKYLGEYLDIHCGGVDNIFPHHTNEIAQSEAFLGHEWCGHWFHVHHLNTKNGKMAKSKGGFLTVSLLKEKGYDPIVYRFFCLGSHYRKSLEFSFENLDNASVAYNRLVSRIAALLPEAHGDVDEKEAGKLLIPFREALDNDLNTSLAITALMDCLKAPVNASAKLWAVAKMDSVLSLDLIAHAKAFSEKRSDDEALPPEIAEIAEKRKEARKNKDFALADKLRDEIVSMGYIVEETRQGTKIYKK